MMYVVYHGIIIKVDKLRWIFIKCLVFFGNLIYTVVRAAVVKVHGNFNNGNFKVKASN